MPAKIYTYTYIYLKCAFRTYIVVVMLKSCFSDYSHLLVIQKSPLSCSSHYWMFFPVPRRRVSGFHHYIQWLQSFFSVTRTSNWIFMNTVIRLHRHTLRQLEHKKYASCKTASIRQSQRATPGWPPLDPGVPKGETIQWAQNSLSMQWVPWTSEAVTPKCPRAPHQ